MVIKCLLIFLPPNLFAPSEFIMAKLPPKYPEETEEAADGEDSEDSMDWTVKVFFDKLEKK